MLKDKTFKVKTSREYTYCSPCILMALCRKLHILKGFVKTMILLTKFRDNSSWKNKPFREQKCTAQSL